MKTTSSKLSITLLTIILVAATVLAGCGAPAAPAPTVAPAAAEPTAAPAAAEPTAAPAAAEPTAAPAAAGTTDYQIAWYATAPHPFYDLVRVGVEAFEKEFNIPVEKVVGPDWKQGSENEHVEAMAAKGLKGLTIYPADASGANGLYEELTKKGVDVVGFGAYTTSPTTAKFVIATDVKAAAMQATEELIKSMGGKGNILNVLEILEDSNTVLRKQGVEEVVAKYPDVKIIQEISGMSTIEEATTKISDALSANIDKVDGVIATGYTTSVGVAQVLSEYKSKGGNRTIHAVGIDTDPVVMKAIEEGGLDGTIVQNPYGMGYLSSLLLKYLADGYTPKEGAYGINAGTVYASKANLATYTDEMMKITEGIKADLLTKYLEKKSTADYKIAWYATAPHPFYDLVRVGVEAFEKEFNIPVEKVVGPDWKQGSENERVEAMAAKGLKGLTIYPADASGANGLYEELTKKGVDVVGFGAYTTSPTTAKFVIATDVKAAAMQATEELIKSMGGKGNILNVLEILEDSNTVLRKQGVEEVVAKYPDVKIIQEISGMSTIEEATTKISDALSANIDKVDGVIATGYTTSVGVAQVLSEYKSKGGNRTIHAVGIDTDPVVMKAIEEGGLDGTIVQNPYGMGYLSSLLLKYLADGYTPKEGAYGINAGTVYASKANLATYTDEMMKITEGIKADLLTKYLEKK